MMDRQSAAYREMDDSDRIKDDEIDMFVTGSHEADSGPEHGPDWYEEQNWDSGRETPKTAEEAQQALNMRIADSTAPDDESSIDAYREGD